MLNSTAISGRGASPLPGFGIQGLTASVIDIPKVFHVSGVYELPVGRSRAFLNSSQGVLDAFPGDWGTKWDQWLNPAAFASPLVAMAVGQSDY
ncbi:MAG: hypothetical protein M3Y24_04695 [Acidobacteriota bacterium]|nr:hypothetical protein [Acidobacteriota bacterium]MDQ2776578.1 hypothetical protein [Acidobacteriota bacterium]